MLQTAEPAAKATADAAAEVALAGRGPVTLIRGPALSLALNPARGNEITASERERESERIPEPSLTPRLDSTTASELDHRV